MKEVTDEDLLATDFSGLWKERELSSWYRVSDLKEECPLSSWYPMSDLSEEGLFSSRYTGSDVSDRGFFTDCRFSPLDGVVTRISFVSSSQVVVFLGYSVILEMQL